jgi:hypothetical protein
LQEQLKGRQSKKKRDDMITKEQLEQWMKEIA